ncbi:MAG: hypothetical protein WC506_07020 [Candidatus Micrarchaeia archaeon]
MKISLTPQMCYLLGLHDGAPSRDGFGVFGPPAMLDAFCAGLENSGLAKPGSIRRDSMRAWIEHAAYESFFRKAHAQRLERFKGKNDYSANYLAGLLDSCGFLLPDLPKGKKAFGFSGRDQKDEVLFLRLGFKAKVEKKTLLVADFDGSFSAFVKPHSLVKKDILA